MRRTAALLALLVAAGAGAAAQTGGGFTTLFNGKDLSNWNVTGNADWRVAGRHHRSHQGARVSADEGVAYRLRASSRCLDHARFQRRRAVPDYQARRSRDRERLRAERQ